MKEDCKCQCEVERVPSFLDNLFPPEVLIHEPNECPGTPIGLYKRDGKEVYLCESCVIPSDVLIASWDTVLERRLSR